MPVYKATRSGSSRASWARSTSTRPHFPMNLSRLLVQLALAAAGTSWEGQITTGAEVTKYSPHVVSKLLATDNVIQRQMYAFPGEYAAIDCDLTLVFSSGLVFGPVSLRLLRDEETTTTR